MRQTLLIYLAALRRRGNLSNIAVSYNFKPWCAVSQIATALRNRSCFAFISAKTLARPRNDAVQHAGGNPVKKDLNYYLKLPWSFRFEWSDEDNCYVASVAELPGCMSDGQTIGEAARMIREALISHVCALLKHGDKIPEPPKPEKYKGNIPLRVSPEKHCKLARRANAEGKSVNKLLNEIIDKGIA